MSTRSLVPPDHPQGEHAEVDPSREDAPVVVDTFGGRVHVEWAPQAPVTPLGQLPFFIEYLRLRGLFDFWMAAQSADPGAHITGLRGDGVNPGLLGMSRVEPCPRA